MAERYFLWVCGSTAEYSENDTQKKADEGDEKARMLLELIDRPAQFVNAIPLMVMASGICFGCFSGAMGSGGFSSIHTACSGSCSCSGSMCDTACRTWNSYLSPGGYLSSGEICIPLSEAGAFLGNGAQAFTLFITWIARLAAVPFGVELNRTEAAVTEGGDYFHCG